MLQIEKQLNNKQNEIVQLVDKQNKEIDFILKEKIMSSKIFYFQALDYVFLKSPNSS